MSVSFGALGNNEIVALVSKLHIPSFKGAISKDQLPQQKLNNVWWIINLQSFDQGDRQGTHWVYFGVKNGEPTYFDSFGQPSPLAIREYAGKPITESDSIYQHMSSEMCGWFCLYVAEQLWKHNKSFASIVASLCECNQEQNDAFLRNYFFKLLEL